MIRDREREDGERKEGRDNYDIIIVMQGEHLGNACYYNKYKVKIRV